MDYRIEVEDLNVYFGEAHILKDINLKIRKNKFYFTYWPFGMWKINIYTNFKPYE